MSILPFGTYVRMGMGWPLEDAAIAVAYLGALGGPRHAQAVATLHGIVERA